MQEYIERLVACGMRLDHALVLVEDFLRDLDFDGLDDYCREFERLRHDVEKV